jgi:hypothetical protein
MDLQFNGKQGGFNMTVSAIGVASAEEGLALVKKNHPMMTDIVPAGAAIPAPGGKLVNDEPKKK